MIIKDEPNLIASLSYRLPYYSSSSLPELDKEGDKGTRGQEDKETRNLGIKNEDYSCSVQRFPIKFLPPLPPLPPLPHLPHLPISPSPQLHLGGYNSFVDLKVKKR